MTSQTRAMSFNAAADRYAAYRPSYPSELFGALAELAGFPLAGARVADVGAGTGISTAQLLERGAEVIAVEPGAGMAAWFRKSLPDAPLIRGDANALPLADSSRDLITYAQSWHWTDTARSVPEALRVLRPGGSLAIWWNITALDVPWIAEQTERITRHTGATSPSLSPIDDPDAVRRAGLDGLRIARRHVRWSRTVPLDTHLGNLASHSGFLVMDEEETREFLDAERVRLRALFPDERIAETYVVDLWVAGDAEGGPAQAGHPTR
ncbi:class I SAM-dependent methyltransferase [Streptomyces smyrnaeus]|uniref:class I SAM-dependent methyltransferase n=1 Tax=Streptomyces TaxID=1883 RepID=UPI000C174C7A|nr:MULTISPECIES: class I SAM-dependent methyltransferase [unclassified Streptomyces]MBQ0862377.1 methyltransferase domain-containing protein [Streptomyces sp. RK75]MBQ1125148.1 methyltransferase domain-containing protein [Streptomyces sp. B15]